MQIRLFTFFCFSLLLSEDERTLFSARVEKCICQIFLQWKENFESLALIGKTQLKDVVKMQYVTDMV